MPTANSSVKNDISGDEKDAEVGEDGSSEEITEQSAVENNSDGSGDDKTDGERQTRESRQIVYAFFCPFLRLLLF